jgi:hypothetical protein
VDDIKEWILSKLPLGPAYYPKVLAQIIHTFWMASPHVFCLPLNAMTVLASYKSTKSGSDAQRILVNVLFVLIFFLSLCPSILDESNLLGV